MTHTIGIDHAESKERYGARYAFDYDDRRFTTTEGLFAQTFELNLFALVLREHGARTVLDMPVGTGRVAIPLSQEFSFTGGDISPAMLATAKKRAEAAGAGDIAWIECSVQKLPFPDGRFDAAIAARLFQHVPQELAHDIVCELSRVVRPGGIVILQFRSGLFGVVLKFLRYYVAKRTGNIRHKCIFPDQVSSLFRDHEIVARYGYKFPLSGHLATLIGFPLMLRLEGVLARTPLVRWCGKYMTFVLRRRPAHGPADPSR
jgi:SAM-dependent methyltransferase